MRVRVLLLAFVVLGTSLASLASAFPLLVCAPNSVACPPHPCIPLIDMTSEPTGITMGENCRSVVAGADSLAAAWCREASIAAAQSGVALPCLVAIPAAPAVPAPVCATVHGVGEPRTACTPGLAPPAVGTPCVEVTGLGPRVFVCATAPELPSLPELPRPPALPGLPPIP